MGEVFEVKQATLSEHINNIISSGELDETSIGFSDKSSGGRKPKIYNLDMILSVGYRVNSKRGIAFRRWANSVLKKYVIQGYAINEKRLQALERTVDIQTKMLASTLEVEESDILKAVTSYTDALMLLDQYDHQSLKKPVGNRPIYKITYEECKKWFHTWRIHLNRMYSVWRKKMVKLRVFWQQFIRVCLVEMYIRH